MSEKIAVMHCRRVGRSCTGGGCFRAYYERTGSFAAYQDQQVQLYAFFDCSGCDADKLSDPDFEKKLNRLKELDIRCVHLATCCAKHCEQLPQLQQALERAQLPYVIGSH